MLRAYSNVPVVVSETLSQPSTTSVLEMGDAGSEIKQFITRLWTTDKARRVVPQMSGNEIARYSGKQYAMKTKSLCMDVLKKMS